MNVRAIEWNRHCCMLSSPIGWTRHRVLYTEIRGPWSSWWLVPWRTRWTPRWCGL